MENVMTMTNGFAELSAMDMHDVNGGWSIGKDKDGWHFEFASGDVPNAYNWYKNTYCRDAEKFGEELYDLFH